MAHGAHDGSIASQMEDWIVDQIRAITDNGVPVFEAEEVQPWDGTLSGSISQFTEEMFKGGRDLFARVFYKDDRVDALEEGDIRVVPRYVILVGIRNRRPAMARRGDGTVIGTNRLRDLLKAALHDKQPLPGGGIIKDGLTAIDRTFFRGSSLVVNNPNECIQQTVIEVDESDKAN